MQPLRNCNGPTIRIGREILCLPYAGFFIEGFYIFTLTNLENKEEEHNKETNN